VDSTSKTPASRRAIAKDFKSAPGADKAIADCADSLKAKDFPGYDSALAYVYFADAPGRRAAAKLLTRDEARRIAASAAEAARVVGPPSNSGSETNIWAGDARCDKIDRGLHG
jgi:hypothetical protein